MTTHCLQVQKLSFLASGQDLAGGDTDRRQQRSSLLSQVREARKAFPGQGSQRCSPASRAGRLNPGGKDGAKSPRGSTSRKQQ